MRVAIILGLALTPLAWAQDVELGWRVGAQRVVLYELVHRKANPQLLASGFVATRWGIASEALVPKGDGWKPTDAIDVAFALAMMLPDKRKKAGSGWWVDRKIAPTMSHGGYRAKGRAKLVGPATFREAKAQKITVSLKLTRSRAGARRYPKYRLKEGRFEATLYFSDDRGAILGGELVCERTFEFPKQRGSKMKIPPQVVKTDLTFHLDEIIALKDQRFVRRINEAIDAGTKALLKTQAPDGSFGARKTGETALALMALLKSGLASNHEAVSKGFAYLADAKLAQTYEVALVLCAVEARYAPSAEALRRMNADARAAALAAIPRQLSMVDKDLVRRATRWLLDQGKSQKWWYPHKRAGMPGTIYDNSNSQYAVLGLLSADRCGAPVGAGVWRGVARHWLDDQEPAGPGCTLTSSPPGARYPKKVKARARGWGYQKVVYTSAGTSAYGSMTVGGIGSLAIARDRLKAHDALDDALRVRLDAGIRDGLAWMERNYAIRHNPRKNGWDYYYWYGLERACAFTGREHIGAHDWYREGAAMILARQTASGRWTGAGYATPMALLFLRRGTSPLVLTEAPAK